MSTGQQNRSVTLTVANSANSNLAGYLKLTFAGQTIMLLANGNTLGVRAFHSPHLSACIDTAAAEHDCLPQCGVRCGVDDPSSHTVGLVLRVDAERLRELRTRGISGMGCVQPDASAIHAQGAAVYTIVISFASMYGMNNFYQYGGTPALALYTCDTSIATGGTVERGVAQSLLQLFD